MKHNIIVTHDGIFHADEIFAIALLSKFYFKERKLYVAETESLSLQAVLTGKEPSDKMQGLAIVRTRNVETLENAKANENIFVVDVGLELNYNNSNFDHHQEIDIIASNLLILNYLRLEHITQETFDMLLPLMDSVSDWDMNHNDIHRKLSDFNTTVEAKHTITSNIISDFNREPNDSKAFIKAVKLALDIIDNLLYRGEQAIKAEKTWYNRVTIGNKCAIMDEFCPIWKKKNIATYAIMPNQQGWSITTKDSNKYPLPECTDIPGLIFMHKAKFIAVFKEKADVLRYMINNKL